MSWKAGWRRNREPARLGDARAHLPNLGGGLATRPDHLGEALAGRRRVHGGEVPFPNLYGDGSSRVQLGPILLCAFPAESNYTVVVCVSVCVNRAVVMMSASFLGEVCLVAQRAGKVGSEDRRGRDD